LIDEAVVGLLSMNMGWLAAVIANPSAIDTPGLLGMSPMFAAAYALWPEAVRELLACGGDARCVPEAVRLGMADWEGDRVEAVQRRAEITELLLMHGRPDARPTRRFRLTEVEPALAAA
jgi:hypothetical protein